MTTPASFSKPVCSQKGVNIAHLYFPHFGWWHHHHWNHHHRHHSHLLAWSRGAGQCQVRGGIIIIGIIIIGGIIVIFAIYLPDLGGKVNVGGLWTVDSWFLSCLLSFLLVSTCIFWEVDILMTSICICSNLCLLSRPSSSWRLGEGWPDWEHQMSGILCKLSKYSRCVQISRILFLW